MQAEMKGGRGKVVDLCDREGTGEFRGLRILSAGVRRRRKNLLWIHFLTGSFGLFFRLINVSPPVVVDRITPVFDIMKARDLTWYKAPRTLAFCTDSLWHLQPPRLILMA